MKAIGAYNLGDVGIRQGTITRYPDEGCDLWGRCLSCPLPACREEMDAKELVAALDELTRPAHQG